MTAIIKNSNRSQVAEALARVHGGDRVEGASAESHPFGRVDLRVVSHAFRR